jgi:hypothetical protein
VMHREGVIIDDLDRFALPQLAEIQVPADVHYTAGICHARRASRQKHRVNAEAELSLRFQGTISRESLLCQ